MRITKTTKLMALVLSLLMLFTMIPLSVSAEDEPKTILDLAQKDGESYYLTSNVTVTATVPEFTGALNGNGYTVTTAVPLFKAVDGAVVENMTVEGTVNDMAAVACYVFGNTTFKNIINNANVDGSEWTIKNDYTDNDTVTLKDSVTGGIAGLVAGTAQDRIEVRFENCANSGTIYTYNDNLTSATGGILGGALFTSLLDNGEAIDKVDIIFVGCENTGRIESDKHAGGIMGFASGLASLSFEKCYNSASAQILSAVDAGGILGKVEYTTAMSVNDCHNSGSVSTTKDPAGGIVGVDAATSNENYVTNCTNTGAITATGSGKADPAGIVAYSSSGRITVENCHNSGAINGKNAAGGILVEALAGATVVNCSNTASVICTGNYAAGIVAFENNTDLDIYYCSNVGDIKAVKYAGGIAGRMNNNNAEIVGCYNSGTVSVTAASGYKYGQIAHIGKYGKLENNYYDGSQSLTPYNNTEVAAIAYDKADLGSGQLAYTMNAALGKTVYYQNINEGGAPKDSAPVLDATHGYVFKHNDALYSLAFYTLTTASIRLDAVNHGIRFSTAVNKADYTVLTQAGIALDFGTLITPDAYLGVVGYDFTKESLERLDTETPYLDITTTATGTDAFKELRGENNTDYYYFCGSLSGIKADNYKWDYSAIGYVNLNGAVVYSGQYATRNIYYVASAAYNDTAAGYTAEELEIIENYLGND